MIKQEEIREGMFILVDPDCKLTFKKGMAIVDSLRNYLHSRGVVIQVPWKLPRCVHMALSAVHGDTNPVCPLAKAGCGFFEPLIKEV